MNRQLPPKKEKHNINMLCIQQYQKQLNSNNSIVNAFMTLLIANRIHQKKISSKKNHGILLQRELVVDREISSGQFFFVACHHKKSIVKYFWVDGELEKKGSIGRIIKRHVNEKMQ